MGSLPNRYFASSSSSSRFCDAPKQRLYQRALASTVATYEDARLGFEWDIDRLGTSVSLTLGIARSEAPKVPQLQRFNVQSKLTL
jgi:hypothetical protein